jgi:hypothetical protein
VSDAKRGTADSSKKGQLRDKAREVSGGMGFDALFRAAGVPAKPEPVPEAEHPEESRVARKASPGSPVLRENPSELVKLFEGRLELATAGFVLPEEVLGSFMLPLSPYEKLAYIKLFEASFGRGLPLCRISNTAIMSFTGVRSETTARKIMHSLQAKRYVAKLADEGGSTYDNQSGTLYRVFLPVELRSGLALEGRACSAYFEATLPYRAVAQGPLSGLDLSSLA